MGRLSPNLVCVGLVVALVALPSLATAETVYWNAKELLRDFFPNAEKVGYEKITLGESELNKIEGELGYRPARQTWTIFVASKGDDVLGYALFDEEKGQHEPITFAVQLDPNAVIQRVELVVYRESHGSEVRAASFRSQFVGKDWQDALSIQSDLVAISGATISSRSLGVGARRCAAVVAMLVARSKTLAKRS